MIVGYRQTVWVPGAPRSFQSSNHANSPQSLAMRRAISARRLILSGETARRAGAAIRRTISLTGAETIRVRRQFGGRLLLATEGEAVTLARRIVWIRRVASAASVMCIKAIKHLVPKMLQGEHVVFLKAGGKLLKSAIGEILSTRRTVRHIVATQIAETIRVLKGYLITKVTSPELVAALKQTRHFISIAMGNVVRLVRGPGKFLLSLLNELVTLLPSKNTTAHIALSPEHVTLRRNYGKFWKITIDSAYHLPRSASHVISLQTSELIRFFRTLHIRMQRVTEFMQIRINRGRFKIIHWTITPSLHVFKAVSHFVTKVLSPETVRLLKQSRKAFLMTSAGSVRLVRSVAKHIAASIGEHVVTRAANSRFLSIMQVELVSVGSRIVHIFRAPIGSIVSATKTVSHAFAITSGEIVKLLRSTRHRVIFQSSELVRLPRRISRRVSITSTELAIALKTAQKPLRATAIHIATRIIKTPGKILQSALAQSIRRRTAVSSIIGILSPSVINEVAILARLVFVTSSNIAGVTKSVGHRVARVLSASVVSLLRRSHRLISVMSNEAVRIGRGLKFLIRLTSSEAVRPFKRISKTIRILSSQLVRLFDNATASLRPTRLAVALPRVRSVVARTRQWLGKLSSSFDGTD